MHSDDIQFANNSFKTRKPRKGEWRGTEGFAAISGLDDDAAVGSPTGREYSVASKRLDPRLFAGLGLLLADGLVASAMILVVALVQFDLPGAPPISNLLVLAAIVQVGLKASLRLYPGFGALPEARLRRNCSTWAGAGAITTVAGLGLSSMIGGAIGLFWICFGMVGLLQVIAAHCVRRALRSAGRWGVPVQIIGEAESSARLAERLAADPACGYIPTSGADGSPTILWAARSLPDPERLEALRRSGSDVILVSNLPKISLTGIQPSQHGGDIGIYLSRPANNAAPDLVKRIVDICIALPLAISVVPVVLISALLIRLADPGPAFYLQPREGLNGRCFGVLKLRTMFLDSDRMLAELLARDPSARAEWEANFKLRRDPRVLPVIGSLLRASSLDELPQLWNVLRGDMSLVGPRPFPTYHLAAMPMAFRARRASVVPGLTGLWQISERGTANLADQQALDEFYISDRSFWGDLSIMLRTIPAVLTGRGAH